jgi:transposase
MDGYLTLGSHPQCGCYQKEGGELRIYYIGIDIGKRFHVACVMTEENVFSKHLKFNALRAGYEKFTSYLLREVQTKEHCIIGLEATGHYWFTLFEKLKQDGYVVSVLNPLQVQSFRNGKIRGTKTDDADCELIAKVLKFGIGRPGALPVENLFKLKQLSRFRADLVKQITGIKVKVITVLDIIFPEYETVFYNLFGVASTKVLADYTTAEVIADLDIAKLTTVLEKASKNRVKQQQAELLKQKAKETFGLKYGIDAFSLELKCLIKQIQHLEQQKTLIEKEIKRLVEKEQTQLLTIPGVSYVTAGAILGETVDFQKKDSHDPRTLLAFAGLDPKHRQSGLLKGTARMGKRGSPYLRQAIWHATYAAMNTDPVFKRIYEKQKSRGKYHLVCLSHVAKKLTYVIFSVLKSNKPYESMRKEAAASNL